MRSGLPLLLLCQIPALGPIFYDGALNYVFLGDNTSQAASTFEVYALSAVPEPVEWTLLSGALLLPAVLRPRRRSRG